MSLTKFADAVSTLKFAILDGYAESCGKSDEERCIAIYKSILSPDIRWIFKDIADAIDKENETQSLSTD